MSRAHSAALPIAYVLLRLLIVLNWLFAAAVLLLLAAFPTERWIMVSLDLSPGPEARRLVIGLQVIAAIGLLAVPLYHIVLTRLVAMIETVRAGAPFLADNAERLRTIAWASLGLQLISMIIGLLARTVSTPEHKLHLGAGFSVSGWLAVLLLFVLARVFAEGARMRDELEGTI